MSIQESQLDQYRLSPNARLLSDPYRLPVERVVSAHYRREWRVRAFTDMAEFASHPSAILSDGGLAVFAKLSEAAHVT